MWDSEQESDGETRHSPTKSRWRIARGSRWTRALAIALLVVALAMGSVLVTRSAHAASPHTVCASGCDFVSINDAIAAAAPGDTINVGPGTYGPNETGATTVDSPINIDKPLTLTGAGVGSSIINDAPANQGSSTSGVVQIAPAVAGDTTVSGFTIEGAIVNDQNDDGILMTVSDTGVSGAVTIKNDLFYGDSTIDPSNQLDQTDAIYVYGSHNGNSSATVNITNNSFKGVFRAALVEGFSGAFSFTGNDLALHGLYDPSISSQLDYWAEGLLFLADGGFDTTAPQVVSGNTFENYAGLGVAMDAGYPGGYIGALSNVSITNNTFNNLGVAAAQSSLPDDADIYMHAFGDSNGSVTSIIEGVTIKNNIFQMSSATGNGYGIAMHGAIGGSISIDHNAILGSGSAHPLAGIDFMEPDGATGVSVTNTIISGFATGLNSDTLPSGATVSATNDCIMGNSSAGVNVASGVSLAAAHTWWGAASGPLGSSNPSGTGNAANGSVTFTPFLTSPASICAGPVASSVHANPNPAPTNSTFTLTASLSDSTTGGFSVASAQYNVNGGSYHALNAQDGSFNQVTEAVTGHISITGSGVFTVCVRGADSLGNVGATSCITVTMQNAATATPTNSSTPTATGTATATTTATAEASPIATAEATATSQATPTPAPIPAPPGNSSNGEFSLIPVLIGAIALLIILGLFLFFLIKRRSDDDQRYA